MNGRVDEPSTDNDLARLLQKPRRRDFFKHPVKEGWIIVYKSWQDEHDNGAIYSALVPIDLVPKLLKDVLWDLGIGESGPGCSASYRSRREEIVEYHRFCNRLSSRAGIEPLVLNRTFHGIRPNYIELLEEFRLFHNLYHDRRTNLLLKFDDAGNDNEVVRIEENCVLVKARELRQFLAIKEMSLVLQIDSNSHSHLPLTFVPEHELEEKFRDGESCWNFGVYEDNMFGDKHKSFSRLLGKRVIVGVDKSESEFWPYNEGKDESYLEFVIGTDENGDPIRFTCDPDKLANCFGANADAPHYLTPVYFRREVLQRYYSDSTLYRVEDSAIHCGSLWLLRIDNHLTNVNLVSVFLGDLGRLPTSEREYWIAFNVQADAGISNTNLLRGFHAEFTDPERSDFLFKCRFKRFQDAWHKKYGWRFFKPLATGDEHLFITLREPLNDNQGEFDSQVLALTKIVIDSLNKKRIQSALASVPKEESKSINILDLYLSQENVTAASKVIEFLRTLQSLRSTGVAHGKGSNYDKAAATLRLNELGTRTVFRQILTRAREDVLEVIGDHFLEDGWR